MTDRRKLGERSEGITRRDAGQLTRGEAIMPLDAAPVAAAPQKPFVMPSDLVDLYSFPEREPHGARSGIDGCLHDIGALYDERFSQGGARLQSPAAARFVDDGDSWAGGASARVRDGEARDGGSGDGHTHLIDLRGPQGRQEIDADGARGRDDERAEGAAGSGVAAGSDVLGSDVPPYSRATTSSRATTGSGATTGSRLTPGSGGVPGPSATGAGGIAASPDEGATRGGAKGRPILGMVGIDGDRGASRHDPSVPREHSERIVAAIEQEIVPRLLALQGAAAPHTIEDAVVEAVADAAVAGESALIEAQIASYAVHGRTVGDALLAVVAPAARRLGVDWEDDVRDFMDVTIGLGTLHRVVLGLQSLCNVDEPQADRRILLGPTPGETHVLGLAVVDHFFRTASWDVDYQPYADRSALVAAVGMSAFSVVGLSLSGDTFVREAKETIAALREASVNGALRILVGGPAFDRQRELARLIGADALALDGRDAVEIANAWLQAPAGHKRGG